MAVSAQDVADSHFDRAVAEEKAPSSALREMSSDNSLVSLSYGTPEAEATERKDAINRVRRLANRHGCKPSRGICPDPEAHALNFAPVPLVLEVLGLIEGTAA